jgi:hypothetical protein
LGRCSWRNWKVKFFCKTVPLDLLTHCS